MMYPQSYVNLGTLIVLSETQTTPTTHHCWPRRREIHQINNLTIVYLIHIDAYINDSCIEFQSKSQRTNPINISVQKQRVRRCFLIIFREQNSQEIGLENSFSLVVCVQRSTRYVQCIIFRTGRFVRNLRIEFMQAFLCSAFLEQFCLIMFRPIRPTHTLVSIFKPMTLVHLVLCKTLYAGVRSVWFAVCKTNVSFLFKYLNF